MSLSQVTIYACRGSTGDGSLCDRLGKLTNIGKAIPFSIDLGIPAPSVNAYVVSGLEFGGGLLRVLGVRSRLIALPLVIDLIVP